MKVMVNVEVDVPDQFVKNGEPSISVIVYGLDEKGLKSGTIPADTYIFKVSEMTRF